MKKINIISVCADCGASKRGASLAPQQILDCNLQQKLTDGGCVVTLAQEIATSKQPLSLPKLNNYLQVQDVNNQVFDCVSSTIANGQFPLIIGGDHSVVTGSVLAVNKHYGNVGVVWIDAHGDWNDQDSTPSGNMHGMSFSASCGWGPNQMCANNQQFAVNPHNCVVVGARDLDELEAVRMKKAGVNIVTAEAVQQLGIDCVIDNILQLLANVNGIYISCDIDSISPQFAPGTGTPVENGLTDKQVEKLLKTLVQTQNVVALDVVEVNPLLDTDNQTSQLACKLITSALTNK